MLDRLLRDGFLVLAVVFVLLRLFQIEPWDDSVDAYAYWTTRDGVLYEDAESGRITAYLYSPAFAQLLTPFVWVPWPIFAAFWTALNFAVYGWLAGRLALPLLLFIPFSFEIVSGNVHLLLAAMIVLGLRTGWPWALGAITKATPFVGVLWHLVRREWRLLGIAAATTGAIIAVSYLLAPAAWAEWLALLVRDSSRPLDAAGPFIPIPVVYRLLPAILLIAWGAWTNRAWTLPIGLVLALPIVWVNSFAILAALIPLTERGRRLSAWRPSRRRTAPAQVPAREPMVDAHV